MKLIRLSLLSLMLAAVSFGQNFQVPPPPSPVVHVTPVGVQGFNIVYYMVVANFPSGAAQSQIIAFQNSNATLTGSNYNQLGWQPITGALNYDVLKLPTNAFTGTCTCSLVVAQSAATTSYSDQGGSLSSYTIGSPALAATASLVIDNTDTVFPKFRIKIGNTPGVIADHLAEVPSGTALPMYCQAGDIFVLLATPGANVYNCPVANTWVSNSAVYNCLGTPCVVVSHAMFTFRGTGTLVSGTPSTYAITGMLPAFTSTASYTCVAEDTTTIANNIGVLAAGYVSGSAVTFTGPATNTDGFRFVCTGW